MSIQPQWVTAAGSLGTIPEGVFYSASVQAIADGLNVFFKLIAGELPDGVQINTNGTVQGVPRNKITVQGVPDQVNRDVTSKFAIRAYTTTNNQIDGPISRISDRTFALTVTGQNAPDFITPAGNIGTYYDGTPVKIQVEFEDVDPGDQVTIKLLSGELPPGLVLDPRTGLISGVITPLVGPAGSAPTGFSATQYDQYPFDFSTRSASKNYQFTLVITDGKNTNVRTFEIYVYSKDSMSADTTDFTADNTWITADVVPTRTPVLLTPAGDLGIVRADNFYAFKFDAIDFDGDPIEYSVTVGAGIGYDATPYDSTGYDRGAFSLPPGLQIDPYTGWFYGYIPNQGATQQTYRFAIRVFKQNNPTIISDYYYFTITVIGNTEIAVTWLTGPDLGTIDNGSISTLYVAATNVGGRSLQYRLVEPGSRLPQGLTLQPSGDITGRVSFNTFALDGGTTTFDVNSYNRSITEPTTFDTKYTFTVNAYAPESAQIVYQVGSIVVTNGGSGYIGQPVITISAPPDTVNAEQATAGVATINAGSITAIALGNPGRGYTSPPTITITGGGGIGATATATIIESQILNSISVFRTFTVQVIRKFDEPYETLYVKCMPPLTDRDIISQLVQNKDIIPVDAVYRADDPNFGVASNVTYDHAYGLTASTYNDYMSSLVINHYWKNVVLGEIKTAQALDSNGNVLYEVVYSTIIDDLVNNQGQSVSKKVNLPYPAKLSDDTEVNIVYPNSLVNMRNQVIDTVGQISPALPLWMTSKQSNGRVLGFTPAWVIAYVKPGQSSRIAYNIREKFGEQLNIIDFKIDRYEIDRSQTYDWNPTDQQWIPQPPAATTFDGYQIPPQPTTFDGGATVFITPADRWTNTDTFDKYLVFPRINILE